MRTVSSVLELLPTKAFLPTRAIGALKLNRLHSGLLVEADHYGPGRRSQVQFADFRNILTQERVRAVEPAFGSMGPHFALYQDALNAATARCLNPTKQQVLHYQIQRPPAQALPIGKRIACCCDDLRSHYPQLPAVSPTFIRTAPRQACGSSQSFARSISMASKGCARTTSLSVNAFTRIQFSPRIR